MKHRPILLFGTTRYSRPLSQSDSNKFAELANIASVNLLNYGDGNTTYEESGIYIQNIKEPKYLLIKYIKFYFFSIFKVRKIIKEKEVSIVFAKDAFTGLPVVLAKKIYPDINHIKIVIESHGDYREMVFKQRKYLFEKIYKIFVAKIGSYVINNSDMVRGVSSESVLMLTNKKKIKSVYFPAWVDNNIFTTENSLVDTNKKDILFVGNIIPRKGVMFLLESFKTFSEENADASFLLIGDTPNKKYFEECTKYVESNGLQKRVKFLGKIDQDKISNIMNKSRILVLASSYEGLPRVLIEAGLCSLPSIAPNIDGISSPFGDKGGTVTYELDNHEEYIKKLNNFYINNNYYSELSRKAYKISNELSGDGAFAENWSNLIEEVMK
tara:strand:+ start:550 stop:1698 length:1149 start_codon:yes stop_codon:yes gene_type:complete